MKTCELMKDYSNSEANPYADDPIAKQAVRMLVKFMIEKVNPAFSEAEAWEWYIQNRPLVDAEDKDIESRIPNKA